MSTYQEYIDSPVSEKIVLVHMQPTNRLVGWTLHSGAVYKKTLPYYAIRLAVDGTDYTEVASIAAVDAAGKWFYDSATKILYARVTGDVDPSTLFSVVEYRLFFSNAPVQATHDLTGSGTTVEYEVILEKTTEFGHKLNTGEQRGLAAESSGSLDFINSGNYWADKYDKLIWENRDVKVYSWGRDVDVTNARQIFNGKIQSKSYSNKGVSFKLADFAFKLREQPVIANYTQADGDIPDSVIGKPKRRIYGRAEVLAQPLDMILDGYDMDGTFTITSGNATVTTSVDQRGKVFQGDEVTFNGSEFKIDTATASTLVLTEAPDFSLSNTTGTVKPPYHTSRNRSFLVTAHANAAPATTVVQTINSTTIEVADTTDFFAGDNIYFGGTSEAAVISRVSGNLLKLTAALQSGDPAASSAVTKRAIQAVYNDELPFQFGRDWTETIAVGSTKITLDTNAEFNITNAENIGTMTFTNGSASVTFTGTKDIKPRDWVKPSAGNWYQVLAVNGDGGSLTLTSNFAEATTGAIASYIKRPRYVTDKTRVLVDSLGVTKDNTVSGDWVQTVPEAVEHLLNDVNITNLNTSSITTASSSAPYTVSMVIPETPRGNLKQVRSYIDLLGSSIFGNLHTNNSAQLEYSVLDLTKPTELTTTTWTDNDIISYAIRTNSDKIYRYTQVNYRFNDADRFTGERSFQTIEIESEHVKYLIETTKKNELNIYLYDTTPATTIANRLKFLHELSNSDMTIRAKLNVLSKDISDSFVADFDNLYQRFGATGDGRKINLVSGITTDGVSATISTEDVSNIYNRIATYAPTSANDFGSATTDEKFLNGFYTETTGLVDNDEDSWGINLYS